MKGFNIAPTPTSAAAALNAAAVAAGLPNCGHLAGVADLLACAAPSAGSAGGHSYQGSEDFFDFLFNTVFLHSYCIN